MKRKHRIKFRVSLLLATVIGMMLLSAGCTKIQRTKFREGQIKDATVSTGNTKILLNGTIYNGLYRHKDTVTGITCYIYDNYRGAAMHCMKLD
jgi:hypothetical protein